MKAETQSERHSAPINLLDWYDQGRELILVLKRPMSAVDLRKYVKAKKGCLKEEEVKVIMRQLVDAAIDLQEKKIFQRDFKMENLLIDTGVEPPRVRVIDFDASCFVEEGDSYDYFMGTHVPPEWYSQKKYEAGPTTVFQIGAVLVDMLEKIKWCFSENCEDFAEACLHDDPEQRLTLEQLRVHLWLR